MVTRVFRFSLLAAALSAAGCVGIPEPPIVQRAVDPTSPAAQRVLRAEQEAVTARTPAWSKLTPYPNDVRAPAQWNAAAKALMSTRDELGAWREANPPELTDTEAFAQATRDAIGLDPATLAPAPTPAESAAYAAEQRRLAAEPR